MINLFKKQAPKESTFLDIKPSFKTIKPDNRPSFNQWAQDYRVSSRFERVKFVYIRVDSLL